MNQNQRQTTQKPNFRRQQRRGYHNNQQYQNNSNQRNQYHSRINPIYTAKILRSWDVRKPIKLFKEYRQNDNANPNENQMRINGNKPNLTIYDPQSKIDEMEPIQKKWSNIVRNNNRGNIKSNARIIIDQIDPACFDKLYQQHRFWRRLQNSFTFDKVDDNSNDGDNDQIMANDKENDDIDIESKVDPNVEAEDNPNLQNPNETTELKHLLFNIERKDYFYYELNKTNHTIAIIMKEDSKIMQTKHWQDLITFNWQPTKDTFGINAQLNSTKPIKNYDILINNVPRMGYDDENGNCIEGIRDLLNEEYDIDRKLVLRAYRWRSGIKDIYRNNERKVQVTLDGTIATPKSKTVGPIKIDIQEFDATKVKPDAFKKIRQCWVCKDIKCPRGKCPLFLKLKKQSINEINFNTDIINKTQAIKQLRIVGRCNNCATVGHDASNCNNYRFCILCGSDEHGSRKNRKCVVIQKLMKLLTGEKEENKEVLESEDMENENEFGNNEPNVNVIESAAGMNDSRLNNVDVDVQMNQPNDQHISENTNNPQNSNYTDYRNDHSMQAPKQQNQSQYGPSRQSPHRGGSHFYDNSQRGNYKGKATNEQRFSPYSSTRARGRRGGRGNDGRGRGRGNSSQPSQTNHVQRQSQRPNINQNSNQNISQSQQPQSAKTHDKAEIDKPQENVEQQFAALHQSSAVAAQASQYAQQHSSHLQTIPENNKNAMHMDTGMSQQPQLRDQME